MYTMASLFYVFIFFHDCSTVYNIQLYIITDLNLEKANGNLDIKRMEH